MLLQQQPSTSTTMTSPQSTPPITDTPETPSCEADYPLPANSNRIKVRTNDDIIYSLPIRAASLSCVLKRASHALRTNPTSTHQPYPLPNVSSSALELIMRYCYYHASASVSGALSRDRQSWKLEFLRRDPRELCELASAAYYLEVPELVDLTCHAIANIISGKSAEQIRTTFHIQDDLQEFERMLPSMLPWVCNAVRDARHKVRRKVTHIPGDAPKSNTEQTQKKASPSPATKLSIDELSDWINSGDGKKKKKKKRNKDKTKNTDPNRVSTPSAKEKTQQDNSSEEFMTASAQRNDNNTVQPIKTGQSVDQNVNNMFNDDESLETGNRIGESIGNELSEHDDDFDKITRIVSNKRQGNITEKDNIRDHNGVQKQRKTLQQDHSHISVLRADTHHELNPSENSEVAVVIHESMDNDVISIHSSECDSPKTSSSRSFDSTSSPHLTNHAYRTADCNSNVLQKNSETDPIPLSKKEQSLTNKDDSTINKLEEKSNGDTLGGIEQFSGQNLSKENEASSSFIDCPENMDREVEAFRKRLQLTGKLSKRPKAGQSQDVIEIDNDVHKTIYLDDKSEGNTSQHDRTDKNMSKTEKCLTKENHQPSSPSSLGALRVIDSDQNQDEKDLRVVNLRKFSNNTTKEKESGNVNAKQKRQNQISTLERQKEKINIRAKEIDEEIARLTAEREQIRDSLAEVRVELSILRKG